MSGVKKFGGSKIVEVQKNVGGPNFVLGVNILLGQQIVGVK